MKITIETEAADGLVLNWTGADKDRAEAIKQVDRRALFKALKCEVEFRIDLEREHLKDEHADK